MKLIDRYVYAVIEHLPEDTREDVGRELRANIEDMLPENWTEKEVRGVLKKLGNPSKLANEYREIKRYLIGPELYDNYLKVLKIVVGIVAAVTAGLALFAEFISPLAYSGLLKNTIEVFAKVLGGAIDGAIHGFLWVTLVFVILERTGVKKVDFSYGKFSFLKNEWSVDDLPELPVLSRRKISRGESMFTMIFTVIFTTILYFNAPLIGLYTKAEGGLILVAPLFVDERLKFYMPLYLLVALIQFSICTWKFIKKQWSLKLAIGNAICNVAVCVLVLVMINDISLFNQDFLVNVANLVGASTAQIATLWSWSIRGFIPVFTLICLWDSISGLWKCRK